MINYFKYVFENPSSADGQMCICLMFVMIFGCAFTIGFTMWIKKKWSVILIISVTALSFLSFHNTVKIFERDAKLVASANKYTTEQGYVGLFELNDGREYETNGYLCNMNDTWNYYININHDTKTIEFLEK